MCLRERDGSIVVAALCDGDGGIALGKQYRRCRAKACVSPSEFGLGPFPEDVTTSHPTFRQAATPATYPKGSEAKTNPAFAVFHNRHLLGRGDDDDDRALNGARPTPTSIIELSIAWGAPLRSAVVGPESAPNHNPPHCNGRGLFRLSQALFALLLFSPSASSP